MKPGYTHISFVLDRSGSMGSFLESVFKLYNEFLDSNDDGTETTFSLMQFDDEFEEVYNFAPVKEASRLSVKNFLPRGSTALLDAIGKTIKSTGSSLSKMKEAKRPSKVLFVVLTDGGENASREFTEAKVAKLVSTQQDTYSWTFVFLSTDMSAVRLAGRIGVPEGNIKHFENSRKGYSETQMILCSSNTRYKSSASIDSCRGYFQN